ncbi:MULTISPECIES: hypothetical protein [unclassified Flavobacterium]|uniref:hypothetical protein n=1 Tax=unclassified Flavobacterium TaxID=196869 RepID=UPI000EAFA4C2|nr:MULTISPECIES: hypothetical protein [unclassified Flavobacterium]RKS02629.1 hypothetical protein C8C84_2353 [Flavobacterium sp. 102]
MKTTNNRIAQKNVTNVRLFVLFVLLVLSSNGVFGQEVKVATVTNTTSTEVSIAKNDSIVIAKETTIASMDFAVWFMGTNKTTTGSKSNVSFSKKALINSGINTNSVLIRSLLKKVSTSESSVA